jgi:hypothetical protein
MLEINSVAVLRKSREALLNFIYPFASLMRRHLLLHVGLSA